MDISRVAYSRKECLLWQRNPNVIAALHLLIYVCMCHGVLEFLFALSINSSQVRRSPPGCFSCFVVEFSFFRHSISILLLLLVIVFLHRRTRLQIAALLHTMKSRNWIVGRIEISVRVASGHIVEKVAGRTCEQSQAYCVPKIAQIHLQSGIMDRKFDIRLKRNLL